MSTNSSSIHHIITNHIQDSGQEKWEFICPTCGYRARYAQNGHRQPKLEILGIGDPQARHTSNHTPIELAQNPSGRVDEDDEAWLTAELRQQMEDLLDDVDMGDWELW